MAFTFCHANVGEICLNQGFQESHPGNPENPENPDSDIFTFCHANVGEILSKPS